MTTEEINGELAAIKEQLKTIFNAVEKVDKALNGNGQPGLVERVVKLEAKTSGAWKTVEILGWLATLAVAIYAAFKH